MTETSVDNINTRFKRPTGTNAEYAFNRLRSEAYHIDRATGEIQGVKNEQIRQLYDDVLEGRKKPNAAAVEAGFRSPKVAVRLDNMPSAANTLASRLDESQLAELIDCLTALRAAGRKW